MDLEKRVLVRDGAPVALAPKAAETLLVLVRNAGRLVEKNELMAQVWPDAFVEEGNLSRNVFVLRQLLGQWDGGREYIETVPKRGYRFVAPVEEVTHAEVPLQPKPSVETGLQSGPSISASLIGKKVSHYRVLEVIGAGGMGLVYKAEDLKLGRQVALKFLPEELVTDAAALQRFEREAQTASSLNHPNICTIYEVEEHEAQPFLVMELLEGKTLRERLASSAAMAVPLDELLSIALQICDGLQAAHEKGIIHRDIKPANIFLTSKGVVKILDFGLAKLVVEAPAVEAPGFSPAKDDHSSNLSSRAEPPAFGGGVEGPAVPSPHEKADPSTPCPPGREDAAGEERGHSARDDNSRVVDGAPEAAPLHPVTPADATLTRTGAAMGTAGYMSPEQVRGEKLDARTDIFSFGLVLYEMATGQRAFSGETAAVVHDSILHNSPVPVRELNSTLPARLVTTIDKCLEKDRAQRFQSAAEVRRALEDVKRGTENKVPRRMLAAWSAGILVLVALAVVGLFMRRASHAPRLGASSSSRQVRPLTESGKSYRVAVTPDGSYIAYVKKEADTYELRLLQVATERDLQLLPGAPQRIHSLHFSRDGNFLYFLRVLDPSKDPHTSGVFRIGTLGGPVTTLATDARPVSDRYNSVTVSPDGKQIAYIAQTASESIIVAIDADGSNRRVLAKSPIEQSFWYIEWSPSQDTLAAVTAGKDDMQLFRVDLPSWLNARPERPRAGRSVSLRGVPMVLPFSRPRRLLMLAVRSADMGI